MVYYLSSRFIGESWYVVEIGVERLPDKWLIQVYDTRECDPNYTFSSPIRTMEGESELADLPERIAQVLVLEVSYNFAMPKPYFSNTDLTCLSVKN